MFSLLANMILPRSRQNPDIAPNEFADRFTPKRRHHRAHDASHWNPYSYFQ